jgi:hypothetical protein
MEGASMLTVGEVKEILANVPDDWRFLSYQYYTDADTWNQGNASIEVNNLNKAVVVNPES